MQSHCTKRKLDGMEQGEKVVSAAQAAGITEGGNRRVNFFGVQLTPSNKGVLIQFCHSRMELNTSHTVKNPGNGKKLRSDIAVHMNGFQHLPDRKGLYNLFGVELGAGKRINLIIDNKTRISRAPQSARQTITRQSELATVS